MTPIFVQSTWLVIGERLYAWVELFLKKNIRGHLRLVGRGFFFQKLMFFSKLKSYWFFKPKLMCFSGF